MVCSTPIKGAVSKPSLQVLLLCVAGYYFYRAFAFARFNHYCPFESQSVCMIVHELRDSRLPVASARISELGLVWNGCKVSIPSSKTNVVNGTICVSWKNMTRANGYYIVTSNTSEDYDPVKWSVRISGIPVRSSVITICLPCHCYSFD